MNALIMISNIIIPVLIFYIVATGLVQKKDIYGCFIQGAEDGFKTVLKIMPTLIGLMMAVGILRASGFLDLLATLITPVISLFKIPAEVVPALIVKDRKSVV